MDQNATIEEGESRNDLVRSFSDKHLDLLRPSARYYSMFKGQTTDEDKSKYTPLIRDEEYSQAGLYDRPLPCFGCGIGWFSFLLGFVCPIMWYYATILYFGNYYHRDPRERAGLAASAIAAMACSVVLLIVVLILISSSNLATSIPCAQRIFHISSTGLALALFPPADMNFEETKSVSEC